LRCNTSLTRNALALTTCNGSMTEVVECLLNLKNLLKADFRGGNAQDAISSVKNESQSRKRWQLPEDGNLEGAKEVQGNPSAPTHNLQGAGVGKQISFPELKSHRVSLNHAFSGM
ncbi:hypothetical protein ACLOJK_040142, partial [Asimina triloba]